MGVSSMLRLGRSSGDYLYENREDYLMCHATESSRAIHAWWGHTPVLFFQVSE